MNPAISFPKLTLVELRKMVDTRAGFWLQLIVAILTLAIVILVCIFGETSDFVFRDMFALAILPASILLPVIGILLVSSEWSQRTALITFTLVPKRLRVMSAKVAAGIVLGVAVLVISLAVATVAVLAVGGAWTMGVAVFGADLPAGGDRDAPGRRVRRGVHELPRRRSSSTSCCRSCSPRWPRSRPSRTSAAGST